MQFAFKKDLKECELYRPGFQWEKLKVTGDWYSYGMHDSPTSTYFDGDDKTVGILKPGESQSYVPNIP